MKLTWDPHPPGTCGTVSTSESLPFAEHQGLHRSRGETGMLFFLLLGRTVPCCPCMISPGCSMAVHAGAHKRGIGRAGLVPSPGSLTSSAVVAKDTKTKQTKRLLFTCFACPWISHPLENSISAALCYKGPVLKRKAYSSEYSRCTKADCLKQC